MKLDTFDIAEIAAHRWFRIAHGVAIIVTLALPWAIIEDHSEPLSAFVLPYPVFTELQHQASDTVTALLLMGMIVLASAAHLYIKLGDGRGLWPAWVITIAALLLPLWASEAVTVWWGWAATLLLSAPTPTTWCVNKMRNLWSGAAWAKFKGAMQRGRSHNTGNQQR